jgi:hypothetical protein
MYRLDDLGLNLVLARVCSNQQPFGQLKAKDILAVGLLYNHVNCSLLLL